ATDACGRIHDAMLDSFWLWQLVTIDLRRKNSQQFGSSLGTPHGGRLDVASVGHHKRGGQHVRTNFRFVVVGFLARRLPRRRADRSREHSYRHPSECMPSCHRGSPVLVRFASELQTPHSYVVKLAASQRASPPFGVIFFPRVVSMIELEKQGGV